jgi:2-oxoglutarate/2-oxoacid ferredoxin oxidoreductase subunit alpha
MEDISVLIGGRAGDGINSAGLTIAHLLNNLGFRVYMYFDYPSLIKGGHNFAIVRASGSKIGAQRDQLDFILALNSDTVRIHSGKTHPGTVTIYNADTVKTGGTPVQVKEILFAEAAPEIMGNSAIIGAFAKTAGIPWQVVEEVFTKHLQKGTSKNLAVAKRAFDAAGEQRPVTTAGNEKLPLMTGNEAIGLGLVHGGLDTFIAYPMTPTSNLLHFLAEQSSRLPITVVHPENEIGVIIMALGLAYAGKKTAVGTSGGGFCLMTEGLSFAGQAEIPVVIVVGQRTGPSTGLPTYTGQTELHFVLHAGQGEFPRLIVAPGDLEEAYEWSAVAVGIAWKYQIPAIILVDKTLCEGTYCFDRGELRGCTIDTGDEIPVPGETYRRYRITPSGVSPALFPGSKDSSVKVNSYTHDESGYTTEEPAIAAMMAEKRLRKTKALIKDLDGLEQVGVSGAPENKVALIAWGSNKGVVSEVTARLGFRFVQPRVLSPFPAGQVTKALEGISRLIVVEDNAEGQLAFLLECHGIQVHDKILKYDGRPFSVDGLLARVGEVLK